MWPVRSTRKPLPKPPLPLHWKLVDDITVCLCLPFFVVAYYYHCFCRYLHAFDAAPTWMTAFNGEDTSHGIGGNMKEIPFIFFPLSPKNEKHSLIYFMFAPHYKSIFIFSSGTEVGKNDVHARRSSNASLPLLWLPHIVSIRFIQFDFFFFIVLLLSTVVRSKEFRGATSESLCVLFFRLLSVFRVIDIVGGDDVFVGGTRLNFLFVFLVVCTTFLATQSETGFGLAHELLV